MKKKDIKQKKKTEYPKIEPEMKELLKNSRHKTEVTATIISIAITILAGAFFVAVASIATSNPKAFDWIADILDVQEEVLNSFVKLGGYILWVVIGVFVIKIAWALFKNYGNASVWDVPITEKQFPEYLEFCKKYSKKLGLYTPRLYISKVETAMELFDMNLQSNYVIRLDSVDVFHACEHEENEVVVYFDIAKELVDIAYGHRNILLIILTCVARTTPIWKDFYFRILEYSSDAAAKAILGKEEATNAVLWLSNDPDLADFVDKKAYRKDIKKRYDYMTKASIFINNLTSNTPIPKYRLEALENDEKNGKIL